MSSILDQLLRTYDTPSVGGKGSNAFRISSKKENSPDPFASLKRITFYTKDNYVVRLEATFNNGTFGYAGGDPTNRPYTFVFQDDEVLDECTLYRVDYQTGRVAIAFTTNLGRTFKVGDVGSPATQLGVKGSRIYGFFGSSGAAIDVIGLIVDVPIVELQISNIEYSRDASVTPKGVIGLDHATLSNNSEIGQKVSITHAIQISNASTWTIAAGLKIATKTTVTAGIPFVVNGNVEVSAELSFTYTYGQTYTSTKTFQYTAEANVPPQKQLYAVVTATQCNVTVGYQATLTVLYADGTTQFTKFAGSYAGVTSYDVAVDYTQPEPPSAISARRTERSSAIPARPGEIAA